MTRAANAHTVIRAMHAKYVEDITVAEAFNLKYGLYMKQENQPLNNHQRTEHGLKDNVSLVKEKLKMIQEYAELPFPSVCLSGCATTKHPLPGVMETSGRRTYS